MCRPISDKRTSLQTAEIIAAGADVILLFTAASYEFL
jgi:hypothetical protein